MKTVSTFVSLLVLFACISTFCFGAEGDEMYLKIYPVQSAVCEVLMEREEDSGFAVKHAIDPKRFRPQEVNFIRSFLEQNGVTFPEGSFVYYNDMLTSVVMFNTDENHGLLAILLDAFGIRPKQVQIEASFVAFSREQIERLARQRASASVKPAEIKQLWREGTGELLQTTTFWTRSGVNARSTACNEVIYATEYDAVRPEDDPNAAAAILPGGFETREEGMIVNVTPTVSPSGEWIDLTLIPELCELTGWRRIGTVGEGVLAVPAGSAEQPEFRSRNVTTCVVIRNGTTFVMGGWASKEGDKLAYLFMTATLVDAEGRPVAEITEELEKATRRFSM